MCSWARHMSVAQSGSTQWGVSALHRLADNNNKNLIALNILHVMQSSLVYLIRSLNFHTYFLTSKSHSDIHIWTFPLSLIHSNSYVDLGYANNLKIGGVQHF